MANMYILSFVALISKIIFIFCYRYGAEKHETNLATRTLTQMSVTFFLVLSSQIQD